MLIFFCISSFNLHAQTTTGVWKGVLINDSTKYESPFEIVITERNGFVRGYSYVSYNGQAPVLKKVKILFRKNNIALEDIATVLDDSSFNDIQKTSITYATAITGPGEINGIWKTVRLKSGRNANGSLVLNKVDDFRETEIYKQLENLKLDKDLSFNKRDPEPEELVDLAKIEVTPAIGIPFNASLLREMPNKIIASKRTPIINLKEAVAVIYEKKIDTPVVAVVEKKVQAPPPPVVKKEPVVVAAKPPAPPPPVAVVEKKVQAPPPPVVKKEPIVVAAKPPAPPPPVAVVEKKVQAPPPVVKKEYPVQVFVPPANGVATEIAGRKTSIGQSVEFESDSLIVTLYDNGEVDGDTVSVLMNGNVIFSKAGLSTRPTRKTIYITSAMPDTLTLVMYAENLGSLPPNTGLLVIKDGEKIYELRFSADLKTNAAIILRRKLLQ
ncbi:hypothetical protein ACQ33O_06130 [Ferruginibacter sp. SUN002]|uniref:hypothetical protein n=1 Tax=Ferruginibacter sp. SUN002 TaxID=2937789 RepID=UPI003D36A74F